MLKLIETSNPYYSQPDETVIDYSDTAVIKELLVGKSVEKVADDHVMLSDGTLLKFPDTDGGCACAAGCYDLTELNEVENVITNVEFDYQPGGDETAPNYEGYYRIVVFADNRKLNLATWEGTDGNGYYGTGFSIFARLCDASND